jgi:hypothetical protein
MTRSQTTGSSSHSTFSWLLAQSRTNPVRSAVIVVAGLMALSLWLGSAMTHWEDSAVKWLDNAFIVLGGISLASGWAYALVIQAQRREAALSFRHAGMEAQHLRFEAGLILASRNKPLMEWHLQHIPHRRAEFVWTEFNRNELSAVLARMPEELRCVHGPGRDAEEALEDPFDLNSVKAHCRVLLLDLIARHGPEQVCVDLTGGTAVMSVGAFQVAEELGVTSLYLMGSHRGPTGQPLIREAHVRDGTEGRIQILSDHRSLGAITGAAGGSGPGGAQ